MVTGTFWIRADPEGEKRWCLGLFWNVDGCELWPGTFEHFQVSQTKGQGYAFRLFESQDHPVRDPHELACLLHNQASLLAQVPELEANRLGSILWQSIDEKDFWIQEKLHLDLLLMLRFQYFRRGGYDRQGSQVCPTGSTVQMAMPGTDNCEWIAALVAFRP